MRANGQRLGVIGAGNIGGAIAMNLVADGHRVVVHDPDARRCGPLVAAGATVVASPAEVAERSELTFTSLPTPAVMETVARRWLETAPRGAVLVDLTTNAPATVRQVGERFVAAERHLLEAPLTGGAVGARARQVVFMVGGERATYERCLPLLQTLGRATFYLGPLGAGNTAKLVNSLLAFSATWASLEGLAVAAKAGLDLRTMVEGINERGRPTQFALELAAKDAGLLLDLAREAAVPTPLGAAVADALAAAVSAGLGARDFTDLVELIERQAGVTLWLPPRASS